MRVIVLGSSNPLEFTYFYENVLSGDGIRRFVELTKDQPEDTKNPWKPMLMARGPPRKQS